MRIGAPDASLTRSRAWLRASELCNRLGVIEVLDAATGRSRSGSGSLGGRVAGPGRRPAGRIGSSGRVWIVSVRMGPARP